MPSVYVRQFKYVQCTCYQEPINTTKGLWAPVLQMPSTSGLIMNLSIELDGFKLLYIGALIL